MSADVLYEVQFSGRWGLAQVSERNVTRNERFLFQNKVQAHNTCYALNRSIDTQAHIDMLDAIIQNFGPAMLSEHGHFFLLDRRAELTYWDKLAREIMETRSIWAAKGGSDEKLKEQQQQNNETSINTPN